MQSFRPSDQGLLLLVGGLLATLLITTYLNRPGRPLEVGEPVSLVPKKAIQVEVDGAVAHAGLYTLERGATVEDLLGQAVLLDGADLRQMDLKKELRSHQRVVVPKTEWIEVELFGPGVVAERIRLEAGSTVGDLLRRANLHPRAALWRLRKRTPLHNGDRIEIVQKRA